MKEFEELGRAVASLSKTIADFPIGAISLNDLKPTEEKIRILRNSLKELNARMVMLRAKAQAQKCLALPEVSEEDTYVQLQSRTSSCVINHLAIESCFQNSASEDILENSESNEISEELKAIMQKLFMLNDVIIGLHKTRVEDYTKEMKLKCELEESLSDFSEFLKKQEVIRRKKLKETNPEIARQKESIQKRLQKINIMKRLITNLSAASAQVVKENPVLQEMWKKHRELLTIESVSDMEKDN